MFGVCVDGQQARTRGEPVAFHKFSGEAQQDDRIEIRGERRDHERPHRHHQCRAAVAELEVLGNAFAHLGGRVIDGAARAALEGLCREQLRLKHRELAQRKAYAARVRRVRAVVVVLAHWSYGCLRGPPGP